MSGCRVRFAAIAAAGLGVVSFAPGAHANIKICQGIEQSYEQIARGASTVEINDMLFSAADKGCQDLARRLLEAGASLEARDRFGAKPLSHAAASGQIELVALFLDHGAPIDARNLDGSTALFKAAESGRLADRKAAGGARRKRRSARPQRGRAAIRGGLYGQRAHRASS